jgi:hypothetical protein
MKRNISDADAERACHINALLPELWLLVIAQLDDSSQVTLYHTTRYARQMVSQYLPFGHKTMAKRMLCWIATRDGHLAILKWARDQNCPLYEELCFDAAKNRPAGHTAMGAKQWLSVGRKSHSGCREEWPLGVTEVG